MIFKKLIKISSKYIHNTLFMSTGILLWIILLPPIILPLSFTLLCFLLLRLCVHFAAKYLRPDLIPINNVMDNAMGYIPSDQSPVMNVAQIWKLKGKLSVSQFRSHFYDVFLSTQELREKHRNLYCYFYKWCFYCFKKPVNELNLKDHIKELRLESGIPLETFIARWIEDGDYSVKSELHKTGEIETEISNGVPYKQLTQRHIKEKKGKMRPNWEILIIHKEDENETVMLFKVQHGLCDGYTFVHMIEKLTGVKQPYQYQEKPLSFFDMLRIVLNSPRLWLEYHPLQNLCPDVLYPVNKKNPPKWFISFATLDIELIKKIRRKTNTHFNCVLTSAFVGALRKHYLQSGKVSNVSKLPEITWVGSSTGIPAHPAMVSGTMTNHMILTGFRVPLQEEDAYNRVMSLERDFNRFHDEGVHKLIYWALFQGLWGIPSPFAQIMNKHDNMGLLRYTTYMSPLMCSSQPHNLLGHPVHFLYLPVLARSISTYTSVFVVPVSHSGKMDLSISASTEVFEDQKALDNFTQIFFSQELVKLDSLL